MRKIIFGKNLGIRTLASLIIFSSPVAAQNHNVSKSGMDLERLARIPAQMKSFVNQGAMAWRGNLDCATWPSRQS